MMEKNRSLNLSRVFKADIVGLAWKFLKGVWSSFSRFLKRSLQPNQGRRPISSNANRAKSTAICPLVGITQFHHAESLTVSELFAKVQWRIPNSTSSQKTAASTNSVASVKNEINWD
jgi:hypothetical protein